MTRREVSMAGSVRNSHNCGCCVCGGGGCYGCYDCGGGACYGCYDCGGCGCYGCYDCGGGGCYGCYDCGGGGKCCGGSLEEYECELVCSLARWLPRRPC